MSKKLIIFLAQCLSASWTPKDEFEHRIEMFVLHLVYQHLNVRGLIDPHSTNISIRYSKSAKVTPMPHDHDRERQIPLGFESYTLGPNGRLEVEEAK